MSRRLIGVLTLALVLLLVNLVVATAAPEGVGTPTMALTCGDDETAAGTAVLDLNAASVSGDGAAGFNAMVVYDHTKMTLASVAVGSSFASLTPCSFTPLTPTNTGGDYDFFSGSCTVNPGTGVLGSFTLASLTFTKVAGAADGNYPVNLVTGVTQFGTSYTAIYDSTPDVPSPGDTYFLPDGSLTSGEARFGSSCTPTAVELSGFDANNASPAVASAWPLLAGGAALALGGGYALLRRKR